MRPTSHIHLDRRALLRGGLGGAALGALTSSVGWTLPGGRPRSLVLVQLSGGNDGLATVVPHGDEALAAARPSLAPAQDAGLHRLEDGLALHPELRALAARWGAGQLAVIQGAGYPSPNRSHFKSLEIWHTADLRGRNSGDGWVGKLAAAAWAREDTPELVVHLGREAPYSLFSRRFPPIALESPTSYRWFGAAESEAAYAMAGEELCEDPLEPAPEGGGAPAPRAAGQVGRDAMLARLRATLDDATSSSSAVRAACTSYRPGVDYPREPFAARLRDVAALIHAGLGTRVLSATLGGFDTHANQAARHGRLMGTLDAALGAFLDDLDRSEAGRDTLALVFSEFGRRVKENGSQGTDHGQAGPMFVVGPAVRGGLFGARPSLTELDRGDLAHTTDFRSVYGTVIDRWFGVDHAAVLGARYPRLGFV